MVHTCGDLDSVVGSGIQSLCKASTAKVGVVLGGNVAVPGLHGLGKSSLVHAHGLCQFLVGLAGHGVALLDVALNDAGSIDHSLIHHQPAVAAGLSDLGSGNHVTGAHFIDEALALGVDQYSAVAAQTLGDQSSGVSLHGGVDLDLIHVHSVSAHSGSHLNALTLCACGVGGHKALQLGLVLGDHVQICAEAAGGQHHSLGIHGDGLAGGTSSLHAHNSAVCIGQQLGSGGVQQGLHAGLVAVLLQQGDHIGAHRKGLALGIHGTMDTLDGCAAEAGNAVQSDAVLVQPVDGVSAVGAQGLHQCGVVDALAADHGVQLHQLHRVEVALGVCLISSPLLRDSLCQSGDGSVVGILFSSGLQGLFHACGLAELVLILIHGLAGVHAAGSAHGVAAHHGLALQNDHALALGSSRDGSSHACTACTHDSNVCVNGGVLGLVLLSLDLGLVVVSVQAGCGQSGSGSLLDGVGGDSCSGHAVHGNAAALGNRAGQLLQSHSADAGGLVLALGGAAGDLAVGQGQGNGNIAAHTLGCTGELAGHACGGGGRLAAAAVAQQADAHNSRHGQRSHALADLILFHCFILLVLGCLCSDIYQQKRGSCSFGKQLPLAET